jgi:hypothetical protein
MILYRSNGVHTLSVSSTSIDADQSGKACIMYPMPDLIDAQWEVRFPVYP